MKNRQFLCAALLTITGLLMSLRLSHATAQEATVVIAGNHPSVALAGWSHAAGKQPERGQRHRRRWRDRFACYAWSDPSGEVARRLLRL
jgi:hypothetical protein